MHQAMNGQQRTRYTVKEPTQHEHLLEHDIKNATKWLRRRVARTDKGIPVHQPICTLIRDRRSCHTQDLLIVPHDGDFYGTCLPVERDRKVVDAHSHGMKDRRWETANLHINSTRPRDEHSQEYLILRYKAWVEWCLAHVRIVSCCTVGAARSARIPPIPVNDSLVGSGQIGNGNGSMATRAATVAGNVGSGSSPVLVGVNIVREE